MVDLRRDLVQVKLRIAPGLAALLGDMINPPVEIVAEVALETIRDEIVPTHFKGKGVAARFEPHKPKYAAWKARNFPGKNKMQLTGALESAYQSAVIEPIENGAKMIVSGLPYIKIHHFGGKAGKGGRSKIPSRPVATVLTEGRQLIREAVNKWGKEYYASLLRETTGLPIDVIKEGIDAIVTSPMSAAQRQAAAATRVARRRARRIRKVSRTLKRTKRRLKKAQRRLKKTVRTARRVRRRLKKKTRKATRAIKKSARALRRKRRRRRRR